MVTRPDVAATTIRVIRCCLQASAASANLTVGTEIPARLLATSVVELIDRSSPTPTRGLLEVTVDALTDMLRRAYDEEIESLTVELALLSGHSVELLTSRPVLRALVRRAEHARGKRHEVITLCESVLQVLDDRDKFVKDLERELYAVWQNEVIPCSYDQAVARHADICDSSTLAWSVICFESQRHVNLVWHQANKLERLFPDREAADMLALGWMGLRTALRLYDPTLGFSFSTYACTRITGAIRDGVRAENPVPKRLGTFGRKVAAAEEALAHTLGRAPTLNEVASHLGVTLDELKIMPRLQNAASIEELEMNASERGGPSSWLVDDCDPADLAVSNLRREAVENALNRLDPEDAAAVRLLVMDGLRPAEAQSITGEAPRRLRARRERALAVLRDELGDWADGRTD